MLKTLEETVRTIESGALLHISGSEALLRKLPKGRWIGGSTEYFMEEGGGVTTGDRLDVRELPFERCRFAAYGKDDISRMTADAFDNGFSILILPFDSAVHIEYAENAADYEDIFMKNIVGWVAGKNLAKSQTPIVVDGSTGTIFTDSAVALHVGVPDDKMVVLNIVNIFDVDPDAPVLTFPEDGFSARRASVDGEEVVFADYIAQNGIDTRLPIVGDYSGAGINISVKATSDGVVSFFAPVFRGIEYRFARPIGSYADEFARRIAGLSDSSGSDVVFSCNCILNYLYGELEGRDLGGFYGPVTFGEIAYQLVNQTLVYVQIL